MRKILLATILILPMMLAPNPVPASGQTDEALLQIIGGDHRSAEHKARDRYRHPYDTLTFMRLEPDMDVVEIWPGAGGWYAEIIAPYVRDRGTYTAAIFGPNDHRYSEFFAWADDEFRAKLAASPELYDHVEIVDFWPPAGGSLGEPGSKDMVLTFRNLHNWLMYGFAPDAIAMFNEVLEPGGLLAVVDHRADPRRPLDPKAESGYVDEAYAIQVIQAGGFELVDRADINDNPADTADHPAGVWTLPPTYRLEDEDREKYAAIGESDRFTLLFRKSED